MTEQETTSSEIDQETPEPVGEEEEVEPSISGTGCIGVIVSSLVASALLYFLVLSRNPETRGPAYMAVSLLFGFFVVGIIWGVIQQQRESDAARDAEIGALNETTTQDD
jgi:glycerol uptake facilitator-like aquaporin